MQTYSSFIVSSCSSTSSSCSSSTAKMSNANMIVKGDNSYSDLTDQELNPHIQYVERPMMAPLEPWMTATDAPPPPPNSQQSHYYNANENSSFLPTPPGSSHPRQSQQLHQLPQPQQQQNSFTNHEFMSSSSNVPANYQHPHQHHQQVYSPSPSPPRYRHGSIASDSSNPSSTPYGELDEHSSRSSRNHAGEGGGGGTTGGTKMTVNKRDKALERNRQAALRCRQRKKEWLNQLQSSVDVLTKENRALEQQSLTLREEILNLKTVLLAHRDCSHAHLTANSINFDTLLYRPTSNSNAVGAHTSPNSTTPI